MTNKKYLGTYLAVAAIALLAGISAAGINAVADSNAAEAAATQSRSASTYDPCNLATLPGAASESDIRAWRDQYPNDAVHVKKWNRVLLALGFVSGNANLSPMTLSEAQTHADTGNQRWVKVVVSLKAAEECAARNVPSDTTTPKPTAPAEPGPASVPVFYSMPAFEDIFEADPQPDREDYRIYPPPPQWQGQNGDLTPGTMPTGKLVPEPDNPPALLAPDEQDPSGQMWGSALTASKEWVRTETYNLWKVNPDKAAAHQQSHTIPVDTKGNPDSTYEDRRPQDLTHTHDPDDPNYVATHPNTWDIDIKLKSYSHNHGLILYGSHDLRFPCYKGGEDRTQPPPHTCHMRVGYDEQELIARGVSDPAERQRLLTKIKEHCCDQHSVTVPDTAGVRRQRQTDLGIIQAHNRQVRAAWNLLKHYDEAAYTQAMNAWFIANQARKDAYTAEIRAQDDRMQARHDSGLMYVYCPNSGCVIINKYR